MLNCLPGVIVFPLHLLLQMLNLSVWALLILIFGLFKLLLPFTPLTRAINSLLNAMLFTFAVLSVRLIRLFNRVELDYQIDGTLSKNEWYLMLPNHLSWLDIILLTDFAEGRIPAPKFFLKKELIWLPFVGVAAWALDMPFMQRYSREFLRKHPHLQGKDIQTTRKSCEKFRQRPTTVINFVEGSRYTKHKHQHCQSQFNTLLPPKAGGIAFTLAAMGELFTSILDVTLLYPQNDGSPMLQMLGGKLKKVIIRVKVLPINQDIIGDYFNDEAFKRRFQLWLNAHWLDKDILLTQLMGDKIGDQ
ncbi:MAG: 1-acyl-sn-glycerol-3-phosphate acyltransferase [Paraglaciecola sp.]|jgi:1-acyl-sn-glycerol-3-phosphate acyltransferase